MIGKGALTLSEAATAQPRISVHTGRHKYRTPDHWPIGIKESPVFTTVSGKDELGHEVWLKVQSAQQESPDCRRSGDEAKGAEGGENGGDLGGALGGLPTETGG
jgi:hypothetical protein